MKRAQPPAGFGPPPVPARNRRPGASAQAPASRPSAFGPQPVSRSARVDAAVLGAVHRLHHRAGAVWDRRPRLPHTAMVALVAVLLAAVGSLSAITVSKHSSSPGLRYAQVPVGAGGTDGEAASSATTSGAGSSALLNGSGSQVSGTTAASSATATRVVAPVRHRVDPDVFLLSKSTVTDAQLAAVRKATRATSILRIDAARVKLGPGSTTAVGIDPSTFRNYAPDNTAQVDALWQRIAAGDVAVAHAVATALGVKLGDHTTLGRTVEKDVRVGAFATTRLAGVGVVADRSRSSELGLIKGSALVIKLPSKADPVVETAEAKQAVPGSDATALRFVNAGEAGVSGGPTVSGGVPVLGNGWTLPLRLGTFVLSQRFGVMNGRDANGHPGIDLAAPLGTPIYAAAEGDVLYWGPARGFGNWIVLQHPGGLQTVYGHMRYQDLLIPPDAHVKTGQMIARVGSEGESTGPHLHFEVHIDNVRVDPIAFLNAKGVSQIR